ncbi:hypothetical protein BDV10DRAFT_187234 [Aspergillus recurvatus]
MRPSRGAVAAGWALMSLATTANAFDSALQACPAPCEGPSGNWTLYASVDRLSACYQPMLLDFSLNPAFDSGDRVTKLFTCTAGNASTTSVASSSSLRARAHIPAHHGISHHQVHRRGSAITCNAGEEQSTSFSLTTDPTSGSAATSDIHTLLQAVHDYLVGASLCSTTSIFGYYNGVSVGLYAGSAIDNIKSIPYLVQSLQTQISTGQTSKSIVMERCDETPNADYVAGLAVDTSGDIAAVQKAVHAWSNGKCADRTGVKSTLDAIAIHQVALGADVPSVKSNSTTSSPHLLKRGDCTTKSVIGGDSCASLAAKCGISAADFTKYNPASDLCSTLAVGQRVCCSAGTLPDIKPKPNADGSCHTYQVQNDDTCSAIAAANGLKASDISDFNDGTTWGWFGCDDLQVGLTICLSEGDPPMPAPVSNAQCGPTVPGTEMPTNGTALADLNPCPLNACCDIWGQCGITAEYCKNSTGPTDNPGTAPKGQNGCISNCGTKVISNPYTANNFMKIGYYESWNYDRPCLNLRVADIDVTEYTHIHWGFADITDDFNVTINDTYNQWDDFKSMPQVRKILSFGGWGFSTSAATYNRLREAMQPANVDTFVQNVFDFVEANGLDGIDFDWEYPGAPDIPGIPAGLESDGPNYLNFLKNMRDHFPDVKTVSIAAPASYWYLRSFPIADMAEYADYIVYMTYDLHGQWDYGNSWAQEGCLTGNCLRSQVNLTETEYALAMITKAGVESTSIVVGVASYGRSFGMADQDCTGPNCHFTGTNTSSTAEEGECTRTAGMIANAEINRILSLGDEDSSYYDQGSDSNVIVWNNTWAAYMDSDTMTSRTSYYRRLNFGGTVDWAVDLVAFTGDDGDYSDDDDWDEPAVPTLAACSATFDSIDALGDAASSIPGHCATQYTLQTLSAALSAAMKNYTDLMDNGYDKKFKIYADAVVENSGAAVHDFVYQNGTQYFTCQVYEPTVCCDLCGGSSWADCEDYCWTDDECYTECDSLSCYTNHQLGAKNQVNYKFRKEDEPCPPDYSKRMMKDADHPESVTWTLVDGKATQFWADLYATTGLNKTYITFGTWDRTGPRGGDCAGDEDADDVCWTQGYDFNFPHPVEDYDADDVANPKDTAQKGLSRSGDLPDQIKSALFEMATDSFVGDGTDLIDAVSVPILMIVSAVEEMAKVESIASEVSAEEKKIKEQEIIGGFIAAILFLVPVAGEVLGAIDGLAETAAVLRIAGTAADIGLSVADIVKDPSNAALDIMNIIFDAGALSDATKVAKAASLRRTMKEADIVKLGEKVSGSLKSIEKQPPFKRAKINLLDTNGSTAIRTLPELVEWNVNHSLDHLFCTRLLSQAQAQAQGTYVNITHGQLRRSIAFVARRLQEQIPDLHPPRVARNGDGDGEVIKAGPAVLFCESNIGLWIHLMALMGLGIPVAIFSARPSPTAIHLLLSAINVKAVIASPRLAHTIHEAIAIGLQECPGVALRP